MELRDRLIHVQNGVLLVDFTDDLETERGQFRLNENLVLDLNACNITCRLDIKSTVVVTSESGRTPQLTELNLSRSLCT